MRSSPPSPWDVAVAAACAVALIVDARAASDAAVVGLLAVATCVPLVFRNRAPIVVLLLVGAALIACLAAFRPANAAIPVAMVALYTVGVRGDRRRSLVVGAGAALVLVLVIAWLETPVELTSAALRLVLVLSALVVGDTVRSRRALRVREQQDRETQARERLDEERLRIARELHDTIAHALVAINVRAGVAAHLRAGGPEADALVEIKDVSAEALRDLRSTLDVLREQDGGAPTRPAQDLRDLPELIDRARAGGLTALAEVEVSDTTTIASPVGQAGFRIVQESLTNVLRHADATRARVRIRAVMDVLDIEVVDNGRGDTHANGEAGHGLRGMAERATALGGRVDAGPAAGGGWRVHAELPLKAAP